MCPAGGSAAVKARLPTVNTASHCPGGTACNTSGCRGSLRSIAAMTQESVLTRILRHLKRASVLPPLAPTMVTKKYVLGSTNGAQGHGACVGHLVQYRHSS